MDGDTLQSPGRTSKRLIEYSAKRSTNHLGYELNEEQSIFSQSPRQTVTILHLYAPKNLDELE